MGIKRALGLAVMVVVTAAGREAIAGFAVNAAVAPPLVCGPNGDGQLVGSGSITFSNPDPVNDATVTILASACPGYSPPADPFTVDASGSVTLTYDVAVPPATGTCALSASWTSAAAPAGTPLLIDLLPGACAAGDAPYVDEPDRKVWVDPAGSAMTQFMLHNPNLVDATYAVTVAAPYHFAMPDSCTGLSSCDVTVNHGAATGLIVVIEPGDHTGVGPQPQAPLVISVDGIARANASVWVRGLAPGAPDLMPGTLYAVLGGETPMGGDHEQWMFYSDQPIVKATFAAPVGEAFTIAGFDCSAPAGKCTPVAAFDPTVGAPLDITFAPTAAMAGTQELVVEGAAGPGAKAQLPYVAAEASWSIDPAPGTEAAPAKIEASACSADGWQQTFTVGNVGDVPFAMAINASSMDAGGAWTFTAPGTLFPVEFESSAVLELAPGLPVGTYTSTVEWAVPQRPIEAHAVSVAIVDDVAVATSAVDFGELEVGAAVTRNVSVAACGAGAQITAVDLAPPFALASPTLPVVIPASGTVELVFSYQPTSAGVSEGPALVKLMVGGQELIRELTLHGVAEAPPVDPPVDPTADDPTISYYNCSADAGAAAGAVWPVLVALGLVRRRRARLRS